MDYKYEHFSAVDLSEIPIAMFLFTDEHYSYETVFIVKNMDIVIQEKNLIKYYEL